MKRDDRVYQFGPFTLDAGEHLLLREGQVVPLPAKAISTLLALVVKRGHVVEKDVLLNEVWPNEFVEESNLTQHIFMLRKALGETSGRLQYIETIPRRGYRFVAVVRERTAQPKEPIGGQPDFASYINLPATNTDSIAVLPFETLGTTHDEYLGLGIADALITKLTSLKKLIVRPTSVVRNIAKGDPVLAGNALKVANVLEGTIQKYQDDIRVTVQLVRTHDGITLWAKKFDEKFTSIFVIEDSISEQVATALTLKLSDAEQTQLTKRHTESTSAHQSYLRGRYFFEKRTSQGFTKGIEYFESAISTDPNYALAHAGLSDCYSTMGAHDLIPSDEAVTKAKEAARKALSIDPNLAEAHTALARSLMLEWKLEEAEKHFQLAIKLNPNLAVTRHFYGTFLRHLRRFDESLAECKKAEELDPTSAARKASIAATLYVTGHYDEANAELRQALELDRDHMVSNHYLARVYLQQGLFEEAIKQCKSTISRFGKTHELLALLGYSYAVSGQRAAAEDVLAELDHESDPAHHSSYFKAPVFVGLDEHDKAFEWLEKAYEERDANFLTLATEPMLDKLRDDPRFTQLLDKTGFLPHLR